MWRQEDQFKNSFCYIVSLRLAWIMWNLVEQKKLCDLKKKLSLHNFMFLTAFPKNMVFLQVYFKLLLSRCLFIKHISEDLFLLGSVDINPFKPSLSLPWWGQFSWVAVCRGRDCCSKGTGNGGGGGDWALVSFYLHNEGYFLSVTMKIWEHKVPFILIESGSGLPLLSRCSPVILVIYISKCSPSSEWGYVL